MKHQQPIVYVLVCFFQKIVDLENLSPWTNNVLIMEKPVNWFVDQINYINDWRLNLSYLSRKYGAMFVFLQDLFEIYLTGGFIKVGSISRKTFNFNANSSLVCIIALLLIWYIWAIEISPKRKWNSYKISKIK